MMIKIISKYNLALLMLANLASQYIFLESFSDPLFYLSMGFGIVSMLFNGELIQNTQDRNKTPILFWFIGLYLFYHFTLGLSYWNTSSWNYLLARIVTLLIVFYGVTTNFRFYFKDISYWLAVVVALCVVFGTMFDHTAAQGRLYLGFGNPNSTSAISTIGFAGFLYSNRNRVVMLIGMAICLWGVLAGGSRTMLFLTIIALLLRYRISIKTIFLFGIAGFFTMKALPYLGFDTIAIDRLVDVFNNGNFVGSRKAVREATMLMINQRPIVGWGFKSGIQGDALEISQMGSHNGYLDIIKAMGYPCAIILFGIMIGCLLKIKNLLLSKNIHISYHVFIIVAVLLGAMYESMLHGVNYLLNTVFYTSFSVLLTIAYYKNKRYNKG